MAQLQLGPSLVEMVNSMVDPTRRIRTQFIPPNRVNNQNLSLARTTKPIFFLSSSSKPRGRRGSTNVTNVRASPNRAMMLQLGLDRFTTPAQCKIVLQASQHEQEEARPQFRHQSNQVKLCTHRVGPLAAKVKLLEETL